MLIHGTSRKMLTLSSLVVPPQELRIRLGNIAGGGFGPARGGDWISALYSDSTSGYRDTQSRGNGSADRCGTLARRQEDLEGAPPSRLAAHPNAPVVRLHDAA